MSRNPGPRAIALAGGLLAGLVAVWLLWPAAEEPAVPVPVPVTAAGASALPSGQQVRLMEALWEAQPGGATWLRMRYLAPSIGGGAGAIGFDAAAGDMLVLCRGEGLAMLQDSGRTVAQIVISLSDRELDFGASDPEAVQFFEAYRPQDGDCIWEEF